jgi:hypothetical protein
MKPFEVRLILAVIAMLAVNVATIAYTRATWDPNPITDTECACADLSTTESTYNACLVAGGVR